MLILKPFQLVRQRDSMECGVACLSMVCKYYGVKVSLNSIRKICQSSIDGVSMKGIVDAAHALGFQSYGAKIQISALYAAKKTVVLHWNQNHFVVLYKVDCKGRFFWIADPGKGKYKHKVFF